MDPAVALAGRRRRPTRLDAAVTLALLVWALADALLYPGGVPLPTRVLFAVLWTVPLLALRAAPVPAGAVVVGSLLWWSTFTSGTNQGFAPFPSLLVLSFGLGLRVRDLATSAVCAAVPLAAMAVVTTRGYYADDPTPGALVILVFFLGGAWTAGRLVLQRAMQLEAQVERSGQRARAAVTEERGRIARELHDVVAHSLSIISVQAAAAEGLLRRDPDRAAQHLQAVRSSAREALVEMRHLVGVLREDEPTYAPAPSLQRLPELVAEARASGLPVELDTPLPLPDLPPGLDLTAYRIIQEALTNVRRHAGPAPTTVRVRCERDVLHLDVLNAPGRPTAAVEGQGRGLVGMQERVRLYDGRLAAGPEPSGGYAVRASLRLADR